MFLKIAKIFVFWRFGLLTITYLGSLTFPLVENEAVGAIGPGKQFNYWASWAQWDGGHYLDIATSGYSSLNDYVFFPLFPAVVRMISQIFNFDLIASGLLVTNLAFIIFLFVFFRLVSSKFNQQIAYNSAITLMVFPTSFFATAYYSESIFLLLTALAFFFLHQKNMTAAAVVASFASLTRLIGSILIVSIFYAYFSSIKFNIKSLNIKFLHACMALFGISIYSIYLLANLNNPVIFLTSQSIWQRSVTDPVSTISSYFWPLITNQFRPFNDWLDLAVTLLFLTVLILGIKKISSSLWIFSMLAILIPASSGTLTSMPRYLLASLGTFIIIAQYLTDRPSLKYIVWTISLLLQIFFAVRFINGYWVA